MIFEAITAIKVANDCIATLREAATNINSISDIAGPLGKLVDAEDTIQKKAEQGDMDAFFALEELRRERTSIRELMQWHGRGGLWDDFVRFEKTRRELRENERKRAKAKKLAKKKIIKDALMYGAVGVFTLGIIGGAVAFMFWLVSLRGR